MKAHLAVCKVVTIALLIAGAIPAEPSGKQSEISRPDASYVLGPHDVLLIQARDAEEISQNPVTIGLDGEIRVPIAGRIKAGGLSVEQLEAALLERLRNFIRDPEVVVRIQDYRSQPVSVVGAVKTPGTVQIQGQKKLIEVLALAGGLAPDSGQTVNITRQVKWGPIPAPNVQTDATGQFTTGSLNLKSLMDGTDPSANITIYPNDVISVPQAPLIYVLGEVRKPGGFVMRDGEAMSALVALSLAEGKTPTASLKRARILRANPNGPQRMELAVNLQDIIAGRCPDVAMKQNDVLVVPNSLAKNATFRTIETALQVTTGLIIWGR